MKKIVLGLLLSLVCMNVFSQDSLPKKIKEIGFTVCDRNCMGVRYKYGTEKLVFKTTFLFNGKLSEFNEKYSEIFTGNDSTNKKIGIYLNFGLEKKMTISDKFDFYYGIEWRNFYLEHNYDVKYSVYNSYYYPRTYTSKNNAWSINSGLGLVFELAYKLSQSFSLVGEIKPTIFYHYEEIKSEKYGSNSSSKNNGFSYGLDDTSIAFTLAYRFK